MEEPAGERGAASHDIRVVVGAAAAGTIFEWYDFYIYGAILAVIASQFFGGVNETAAYIFALLGFGAGFVARPFGALVFGRIGDRVGRKQAFLITIAIMGGATFAIGLLPTYAQAGILAPILLVTMRVLQGFAVGGEYGGAVIYVAEHAPASKRGLYTGWLQTTASVGLVAALLVVLGTRRFLGEEAFADWGWRVPFLLSIGLLAISLWVRMRLHESPVFEKIRAAGAMSKAPLKESFLRWASLNGSACGHLVLHSLLLAGFSRAGPEGRRGGSQRDSAHYGHLKRSHVSLFCMAVGPRRPKADHAFRDRAFRASFLPAL